ncbi:MAG: class I SAM-dependent methyltransferase [Gemmatimonadota bacterium]|nr:MAG: class I SAM-dependent methyltransferase [Gemmatimonadota bacterium]
MKKYTIPCLVVLTALFIIISITSLISNITALSSQDSSTKEIEGSKRNYADSLNTLPSVEQILERYIQAIGGREAIERLTSRVCTGKLIHDIPWRKPPYEEVPFEAYARTPDKSLYIEHRSDGIYKEVFNGKIGWTQDADSITIEESPKRSKLEFLMDSQGALHIENYFPGLTVAGKDTLYGREVYAVEPEGLKKAHYSCNFDVKTGMLIYIGYYWELLDYREVDGVKCPFRIAMSRKSGSSTYVFDEVKHNTSIDESLFIPPDTDEALEDPFRGIDDPKVLPMLKHLPYEHGGMNIPPQDGRFLYNLITKNDYTRGLEIGTSNGYSTLWLGLAFRKTGGKVITIEIESLRAKEAMENFRKAGLDHVIDTRINDAFEEIPKIEGDFDFVFMDVWKSDYIKFLRLLRDRIRPGGAITAHNVSSQSHSMQDFLDAIRNDPDLETTLHETSEAWISVSIKRE